MIEIWSDLDLVFELTLHVSKHEAQLINMRE